MKNLRILFIISLSFVYLNGISFINFDFYSSLDKIDDNDVLIGFQFFDSNGDGIKEIFAGFDIDPYLSTNVFRLVQYSAEGELLSTNYQQNINSYVVDYQIINHNGTNLLVIIADAETEWIIKIFDLESFALLSEYTFNNISLHCSFNDSYSFEINNELQILLGLWADTGNYDGYYSHLFRFSYINNVIVPLDSFSDTGFKIINDLDRIFVISNNTDIEISGAMSWTDYVHCSLSQLIINDLNEMELFEIYNIAGSSYCGTQGDSSYDNFPIALPFLSNNSQDTGNEIIFSHTILDSDNGFETKFICYDLQMNEIIWETNLPNPDNIRFDTIKSSSVIRFINMENHIIFFWKCDNSENHNYIVMDKENGNIEIQDEIAFYRCGYLSNRESIFIDLINDDELLFITGNSDGTGFDLYKINEFEVKSIDLEIPQNITQTFNYPNPFNPSTTIKFYIHSKTEVELTIYNIKGQKVKTIVNSELDEGNHSVIWNGDDESGKLVGSGVYFYKLSVNGKSKSVNKCLMLK